MSDEAEVPIEFVEGLEAPPRRRCGPWLERDGFHYCDKCGRLDPLDFLEDEPA